MALEDVFTSVDQTPLATASIAQVRAAGGAAGGAAGNGSTRAVPEAPQQVKQPGVAGWSGMDPDVRAPAAIPPHRPHARARRCTPRCCAAAARRW